MGWRIMRHCYFCEKRIWPWQSMKIDRAYKTPFFRSIRQIICHTKCYMSPKEAVEVLIKDSQWEPI